MIPLARSNADGTGESFVAGMSVPDVLVHTRLAGDAVGATKMDRPEDVEPHPRTGKVYASLTNNNRRGVDGAPADEPNPRNTNRHGHVLELTEDGDDPAATSFRWTLLLVCGDPNDAATYFAGFPKDQVSPISCPDNLAFDPSGNLWIATDGNALGSNDGLFAVPLDGPSRGHVKQFLTVPRGAETCGPVIEDRLALISVQHPGQVDGASADQPASRWPDGPGSQPPPGDINLEDRPQPTRLDWNLATGKLAMMGAMELTVAESVLLLALDDVKGSTGFTTVDPGLARALLMDLGRVEALRLEGKELHPVTRVGIEHPVLSRAYTAIATSSEPRSAKVWVGRLPSELKPLTGTVAGPLVERGILTEHRSKVLGLFPNTRFPEADPGPERALRSRLQDVLVGDRAPQEYDALLLGMLEPLGLVKPLVERPQRREAGKRAQEIVKQVIVGSLTTLLTSAVLSIFAAVLDDAVSAGGGGDGGDGDGGRDYGGDGGGWWA